MTHFLKGGEVVYDLIGNSDLDLGVTIIHDLVPVVVRKISHYKTNFIFV